MEQQSYCIVTLAESVLLSPALGPSQREQYSGCELKVPQTFQRHACRFGILKLDERMRWSTSRCVDELHGLVALEPERAQRERATQCAEKRDDSLLEQSIQRFF